MLRAARRLARPAKTGQHDRQSRPRQLGPALWSFDALGTLGYLKGWAAAGDRRMQSSAWMNSGVANDRAVFLMIPDNQLAKLVAIAEIDVQSQCRHALLDVLKLHGLTRGQGETGN